MAQNERGGTARVVAEIGMHVGAADAHRLDPYQMLTGSGAGVRHIAVGERFDAVIDQSFHFAVNPPSTIKICPVT